MSEKNKYNIIDLTIDKDELTCRLIEISSGVKINRNFITSGQAIKELERKIGPVNIAISKLQAMECIKYVREVIYNHGVLQENITDKEK